MTGIESFGSPTHTFDPQDFQGKALKVDSKGIHVISKIEYVFHRLLGKLGFDDPCDPIKIEYAFLQNFQTTCPPDAKREEKLVALERAHAEMLTGIKSPKGLSAKYLDRAEQKIDSKKASVSALYDIYHAYCIDPAACEKRCSNLIRKLLLGSAEEKPSLIGQCRNVLHRFNLVSAAKPSLVMVNKLTDEVKDFSESFQQLYCGSLITKDPKELPLLSNIKRVVMDRLIPDSPEEPIACPIKGMAVTTCCLFAALLIL